jgi:outer membrane protein TolC
MAPFKETRLRLLSSALLIGLALHASAARAADDGTGIAIIADGPGPRNLEILQIFHQEIRDLLGEEFRVTFTNDGLIEADWTVAGVNAAFDVAFADPAVDVVVGLGLLASHELCGRGPLAKPAVAPFVVDPEAQGLPLVGGKSGVKNLSYVTSISQLKRDFETFREVVDFRKLTMIVSSTTAAAIPELGERARRIGAGIGIEVTVVPTGLSGEEALAALPPDTEAVYLAPLIRMSGQEFDKLVAGFIDRRLPSFSLLGRREVERGVLAGLTPESEFPRLARRTAINIQRMLLGEDGGSIAVHFSNEERLSLNVATARAIGARPSWSVLTVADRVDDERREVVRTLSIGQAAHEAILVNLDLLAAESAVQAGAQDVNVTRSFLLPQLDVSARGILIDQDQASQSLGQAAERTLEGSVTLNQLLYADDAWANFDIEKRLQIGRERARDQLRLDIGQAAATAYLNVLRAKTAERIQKDNLERTQANLDLARARESVGYSGPGEVYRWEGEIARQRRTVIEVNSLRNIAEIELNRLLHRPLEEPFALEDTDLDDPDVGIPDERLVRYLGDKWSFGILREFMSIVARENSPELQVLEESIAAQERVHEAASRSFFIPTIGLAGALNHTFTRRGEGSDGVLTPEDTDWNVGIQASLPIFSGAGRLAEKRSAQASLDDLTTQREAIAERVEQRLRSAMHRAGASFAAIELSRASAEAAHKNLDLVLDSYAKGILTILDLLDAQNTSLVAESEAATSVYDFLINLLEVERAAGYLSCVSDAAEKAGLIDRLERFRKEREGP